MKMRKQNYSSQMRALQENLGKSVTVEYVHYGSRYIEQKKLKTVHPFSSIEFNNAGIPFIGYGAAIRKITDKKGEVLYENSKINEDYDVRSQDSIHRLKLKCFGSNAGEKYKRGQSAPIKTAYLKELLNQGAITPNQFEFVRAQPNELMGRGYALMVVDSANELYKLVESIDDKQTLDNLAGELIELSNHESFYKDHLSKPKNKYSPLSQEIRSKLSEQGHSPNSSFWTLRNFIETVAEKKGIEYTPKPGLRNGAFLTLEIRLKD